MDQTKLVELAEQIKEIYEAALAIEKALLRQLKANNVIHFEEIPE